MDDRICSNVRIAAGAVAYTPFVSKSAPAILEGQPLSEALAEKAGAAVSEEADPQDDSRASAWYKKKVVGILVKTNPYRAGLEEAVMEFLEIKSQRITYRVEVGLTTNLLEVLREKLHIMSPKMGCESGDCGACSCTCEWKIEARLHYQCPVRSRS